MRTDAPPWTRAQADRWRAALPARWLPTPGVLFAVWAIVVFGAVTAPAGLENATEWRIFWMVLLSVIVTLALLTGPVSAGWRRQRGRQEAIAREVAGSALVRWPGPPPDPGDASSSCSGRAWRQPVDGVDLFQRGADRVVALERVQYVHRPELGADSASVQPREVGVQFRLRAGDVDPFELVAGAVTARRGRCVRRSPVGGQQRAGPLDCSGVIRLGSCDRSPGCDGPGRT